MAFWKAAADLFQQGERELPDDFGGLEGELSPSPAPPADFFGELPQGSPSLPTHNFISFISNSFTPQSPPSAAESQQPLPSLDALLERLGPSIPLSSFEMLLKSASPEAQQAAIEAAEAAAREEAEAAAEEGAQQLMLDEELRRAAEEAASSLLHSADEEAQGLLDEARAAAVPDDGRARSEHR